MKQRHHNDGLRKYCGCARRNWAKCGHPFHFNFQWKGKGYRFSLDRHLGRRITDKTTAETEAERIRIAIKDGTFDRRDKFTQPADAIVFLDDTDGERARVAPTFSTVAKQYEERHVSRHLRERSAKQHEYLRTFLQTVMVPRGDGSDVAFADKPFRDITVDDIERAIEAKATPRKRLVKTGKGRKDHERTVGGGVAANRLFAYLRALSNWAIDKGYADTSPCRTRSGKRAVTAHREHARSRRLQGDEEQRLMAAAGPHLRDAIIAALETGCRVGELLSLTWGQVRWLQNDLFLPGEKTKTGQNRIVPISPVLRKVLMARQNDPDGEKHAPDKFVFGNEVGERVGSIKTAFRLTSDRAGVSNFHFHDLRHEAGSRKLEAGLPLNHVSLWLGHRDVATTARYLNATAQHLHQFNNSLYENVS